MLAATFHPELTEDPRLHRLFLALAALSTERRDVPGSEWAETELVEARRATC